MTRETVILEIFAFLEISANVGINYSFQSKKTSTFLCLLYQTLNRLNAKKSINH